MFSWKLFFYVFTNFSLLSVLSGLPPAGVDHQQAFTVPAGRRHPPSRQGRRNMKYTNTQIHKNTKVQILQKYKNVYNDGISPKTQIEKSRNDLRRMWWIYQNGAVIPD